MSLQEIRKFYAGSSPGFRLGWGSGLMSTTVDMRLDDANVGKVLNIISSRHHPNATPREGPKSRKLVESGGRPHWPMGWASLEVR
jgi:CRISPR/Cas system CSM-associated protein Csm5 (group 7 of RAMP superfamily)